MEIVVPELGESIVEATVARWLKQEGEAVRVGEPVVELETDKVDLEVGAKSDGVLVKINHQEGEDVRVGEVLGQIEVTQPGGESGAKSQPQAEVQPKEAATGQVEGPSSAVSPAEKQAETQAKDGAGEHHAAPEKHAALEGAERVTPVARRMAQEYGVDLEQVIRSQPGERITKEHIQQALERTRQAPAPERESAPQPQATTAQPAPPKDVPTTSVPDVAEPGRREERVRMTRRRRTIAERLVQAQHTAAMLTTFNDVDMSAVMDLRGRWKEAFQKKYGVKLGFMSFFVKASIGALKAFPMLNAEIRDDEFILKQYYDIGIAVGAEEGLVVPVLRDADRLSFAQIEDQIEALAQKARGGSLTIDDLRGGTFTITNGGVFGSLLSTPILNPPQAGILGLHRIEQRPVAVGGEVVIRPMMYLALSYDHRIVDGREAVQFLVRVKELIQDPESLLLEG